MNNRKFTIKGYSSLLETGLANGYVFVDFDRNIKLNKFCLLRHDIDADLKAAAEMSAIEKSFYIKATYFLMLRSPIYNLFGRENNRYVEQIIKNGHSIALHYDEGFYPDNNKNLQENINTESNVIERMFGQKINVVSFHQPSNKIVSNEVKIKNYLNTYDKEDLFGINYFSDSNKIWKNESAWEVFECGKYPKVQLLIHPMWWITEQESSTYDLWDKSIINNLNRSLQQVIETERAFGEKRQIKLKRLKE